MARLKLIAVLFTVSGLCCLANRDVLAQGTEPQGTAAGTAVSPSGSTGQASNTRGTRCRSVAAPEYVVHGGNCSRSLQLLGKYSSIQEVYGALYKPASKIERRFTFVTTGNENGARQLLYGRTSNLPIKGCSVYSQAEAEAPKLHLQNKPVAEAEQLAQRLRATEQHVLVVYHFE